MSLVDLDLSQDAIDNADSSCLDRSKIEEAFQSIHSSFEALLPTSESLKSINSDILLLNGSYLLSEDKDNLKVYNKEK